MTREVVVYTQGLCPSCRKAEEYLSRKGVPFVQKNLLEDEKAMEEFEEMGYIATPVVVIDGEVVVGFDRKRIDRLLGGEA